MPAAATCDLHFYTMVEQGGAESTCTNSFFRLQCRTGMEPLEAVSEFSTVQVDEQRYQARADLYSAISFAQARSASGLL